MNIRGKCSHTFHTMDHRNTTLQFSSSSTQANKSRAGKCSCLPHSATTLGAPAQTQAHQLLAQSNICNAQQQSRVMHRCKTRQWNAMHTRYYVIYIWSDTMHWVLQRWTIRCRTAVFSIHYTHYTVPYVVYLVVGAVSHKHCQCRQVKHHSEWFKWKKGQVVSQRTQF